MLVVVNGFQRCRDRARVYACAVASSPCRSREVRRAQTSAANLCSQTQSRCNSRTTRSGGCKTSSTLCRAHGKRSRVSRSYTTEKQTRGRETPCARNTRADKSTLSSRLFEKQIRNQQRRLRCDAQSAGWWLCDLWAYRLRRQATQTKNLTYRSRPRDGCGTRVALREVQSWARQVQRRSFATCEGDRLFAQRARRISALYPRLPRGSVRHAERFGALGSDSKGFRLETLSVADTGSARDA